MNAQINAIQQILRSIECDYRMLTPTSLECSLGRVMEFRGELRFSTPTLRDIAECYGII